MAKPSRKKGSLTERLLANSTASGLASTLDSTQVLHQGKVITTPVPMLNVANSGSLTGGMRRGITMIAGPSRHFKTLFGLIHVASFLKQFPDGVCLFYDSEFGAGLDYFQAAGVDTSRVIHTPITDIEQLKFDLMNQLQEITRDDNVIIFIDSVGNLASKKEVEDALDQKSVADMTRAKAGKSLWRMVTPHLSLKDIPLIAINHTYETLEMFSKTQVSGGTGGILSSDNIWVIGRQQDKTTQGLEGYNFIIRMYKSRHCKEGSEIPINVKFDGGVDRWSGLLPLAIEFGFVESPRKGYFVRTEACGVKNDKQWTRRTTSCAEFWEPILTQTDFPKLVEQKYKLVTRRLISTDDDKSDSEE